MAADSAISARASAAAAGQDAALAAQAADDAFRIAVEKELAEQAELQAGLDAQAADGADPEKPASLLDIIKERIGPAALTLLLDLVGITDLVNCFKGQISGCLWTLVGVIPAAKIAKAAPIVRRLISKTDEIVDALHSRKTLKSRQLDEIHNLPACGVNPVLYSTDITYRPARFTHVGPHTHLFQFVSNRCIVKSIAGHPFRGSSYYRLNATHVSGIQLQRHHLIADEVIRSNRDIANTLGSRGLNPSNAPAIQMTPEDHRVTESWGRKKEAELYRKRQEELFRAGDTNQIFQMEYDFLTQEAFEGRYVDALDEAIQYALDNGFLTKSPSPRTTLKNETIQEV